MSSQRWIRYLEEVLARRFQAVLRNWLWWQPRLPQWLVSFCSLYNLWLTSSWRLVTHHRWGSFSESLGCIYPGLSVPWAAFEEQLPSHRVWMDQSVSISSLHCNVWWVSKQLTSYATYLSSWSQLPLVVSWRMPAMRVAHRCARLAVGKLLGSSVREPRLTLDP